MDTQEGKVFLINKPLKWTSFDVVNRIRYAFRNNFDVSKRYKVGHAGTLDPLADGLLIVCTGKQTKKINQFQGLEKSYTGTITFGKTTPSYDLELGFDKEFDISELDFNEIEKAVEGMKGEQLQYPPIFSAKKVKGKKAYDLARAGKEVKLEPRKVLISKFNIDHYEKPNLEFDITCSKGTYIRSIAHDLGQKVNSGAHLSSLRRTAVGEFRLEDAWEVDDLVKHIESEGAKAE